MNVKKKEEASVWCAGVREREQVNGNNFQKWAEQRKKN